MVHRNEGEPTTRRDVSDAWAIAEHDEERYIPDGVGRRMAEALWSDFLERYPGVAGMSHRMDGRPLELSEAAARLFRGAQHEESWVVGETRRIIREAKICAAIAERALTAEGESVMATGDEAS